MTTRWIFAAAMGALIVVGCQREDRPFRMTPSSVQPASSIRMSDLYPGSEPPPSAAGQNPLENSAYTVNEGKRLFESYNCVGCHAHGGGGIGPPLMDVQWIYGSEPNNIYATIVEGRPNGMPSFRGKIPEFQVWQIVAYVRSLGGLLPKGVAPSRDDHMSGKRPENATPAQTPLDKFYAPQPERKK